MTSELPEAVLPSRPSPRSKIMRERITEAVATVISEHGIAGLTHRRVAQAAKVPIAATTYHYRTKGDMLADALRRLLDGYLQAFARIAARQRRGDGKDRNLDDLVTRIVVNAAETHRRTSLAWCEIMLDAARTAEGHRLATRWFSNLEEAWGEVAATLAEDHDATAINVAIDTTIGLLFIVLALGVAPSEVEGLRLGRNLHGLSPSGIEEPGNKAEATGRAGRTRSAILASAVDLLVRMGSGSISHRTVSAAAGVALTASAYHFGSIDGVIRAAQASLFEQAKQRYRVSIGTSPERSSSPDELADLTAAILVREATEFGQASIAHYSIWLEAARVENLRPEVAAAVVDQAVGWQRRLAAFGSSGPQDGISFQALFIGHLVRSLACGASLETLAPFRAEVRHAIRTRFAA